MTEELSYAHEKVLERLEAGLEKISTTLVAVGLAKGEVDAVIGQTRRLCRGLIAQKMGADPKGGSGGSIKKP